MMKTGLKYIGILLLTAALAAPFVWVWRDGSVLKPQSQNPEMKEPADLPSEGGSGVPEETPAEVNTDSVALPSLPILTAEPELSVKKREPVIDNPASVNDQKAIYQDKILPDISISDPGEEISVQAVQEKPADIKIKVPVEVSPEELKEQPQKKESFPSELPPLAFVEAEVPATLDVAGGKMIRTSLRLVNHSAGEFTGQLQVKTPRGVRSVSGELISVSLNAGDTLFVPTVFMLGGSVPAGENRIDYTLKDQYDREVEKGSTQIPVAEKVSLQLSLDQPMIMVTHMNDSLAISARVHNRGNTDQQVTVVMSVPVNRGGKSFYELQGWVYAGQDSLFVLKIHPADIQWNENSVVYVNISGLYGLEKQIFGNVSLTVQNVISARRYVDNTWTTMQMYDMSNLPGDITLSYRRFGQAAMYQVMGGGHIDLPVGNLGLQGLIYKVDGQDELIALNTHVAYRYNRSSFMVGNVNEQMEFSTFGRGAKAVISDKSGKNTLKVGVVDNQFNLLSSRSLFENGYSIFVKDYIGAPNARENFSLNYMFRDDQWENVRHHMAGGEWQWNKDGNWRVMLRSHGALSDYTSKTGLVPSGSAEIQYNGALDDNYISGNFYYSTSYFPGNRRGTLNLQQNINKKLKNGAGVRGMAFYSNFSPRSYHYTMNVETSNGRVEGVYTFPNSEKPVTLGLGYQYQTETGNLAYLANSDLVKDRAATYAHRLVENLNWRKGNHNVNLGVENGMVKVFNQHSWEPQGKALLFYGFKRFNVNASYQHGGYYLSEQNFAQQMEKVTRRLMANASWSQDFLNQNLLVNSGINYSRDFIMGSTWAGSLNSRYHMSPRYSVFLNSAVYNYSYSKDILLSTYNSTMFNVEAGVSLNLQQDKPATGKKSRLTVTVFHDNNGNNIRDTDETAASDYMVILGDKLFVTDDKGQFSYTSIPFGTYTVKAGAQAGWFHTEKAFLVNKFKEGVEIPLRQAGSVRGSIRYVYDPRTAKDFTPIGGGLILRIFQNGQLFQRAVTDNDGQFIAFLPNGEYTVELETGSLDANAYVQNKIQGFRVEAGQISSLEPFVIEIRSKKINIRQFVQVAP